MNAFIPDQTDDADMIDGFIEWLTEDMSLFDRRAAALVHAVERLRQIIDSPWTTSD